MLLHLYVVNEYKAVLLPDVCKCKDRYLCTESLVLYQTHKSCQSDKYEMMDRKQNRKISCLWFTGMMC